MNFKCNSSLVEILFSKMKREKGGRGEIYIHREQARRDVVGGRLIVWSQRLENNDREVKREGEREIYPAKERDSCSCREKLLSHREQINHECRVPDTVETDGQKIEKETEGQKKRFTWYFVNIHMRKKGAGIERKEGGGGYEPKDLWARPTKRGKNEECLLLL